MPLLTGVVGEIAALVTQGREVIAGHLRRRASRPGAMGLVDGAAIRISPRGRPRRRSVRWN